MTKIVNLSDTTAIGSATLKNGDFLTFDGLPNNRFSLIIPSLPHVEFFLQIYTLPDIRVNEVKVYSPFVDINGIGEKVIFEPFSVDFLVDKYSRNWSSVFNWMKEMTVNGSNVDKTDDIVLMIDGKEFMRFYGAWPTSLSGYNLDSTVDKLTYVKSTIVFNYDYFAYIGQFATTDSDYNHVPVII